MNTNYQLEMEKAMAALPEGEALLLHACCGPCASAVVERLSPKFALRVYYYNPNIAPLAEHTRRRENLARLLNAMPLPHPAALLEDTYDPEAFRSVAKGLEAEPEGGARCAECFRLRLFEAARKTKEAGVEWFTTTLTVSPHKNAPLLNAIGKEAAEKYGVRFLPSDFKKKDGYRRSIALATEYGLYRQDYCGCVYSVNPVNLMGPATPAGNG